LLNFGPKAVAARKVYDNERKGNWARKNTEKKGEEWDMDEHGKEEWDTDEHR